MPGPAEIRLADLQPADAKPHPLLSGSLLPGIQFRTPTIHVGELRTQAGWEAKPATAAEHAGVGRQGIEQEAGGTSSVEPVAVGGLWLSFGLGGGSARCSWDRRGRQAQHSSRR
jgi:hypothetical protein